MAVKYQDYLAAQILSENNIVSYRQLSRALKVHCNAAKEMLYDFHRTQNARKPGTIHASYLLSGTPKRVKITASTISSNGMSSTPVGDSFGTIPSSSMPDQQPLDEEVPTTGFTLVKEENLDHVKSLYEQIASIHIYSLEPSSVNDLQILSACNQHVARDYASEDPLETWKQYGTIRNSSAKRRTNRQPPVPIPAAVTTPAAKPQPTTKRPAEAPPPAADSKPSTSRPPSRQEVKPDTKAPSRAPAKAVPALKRDSSSIFKSFAKAKEKSNTSKASTDTSRAASPASAADDEPMQDAEDDNDDTAPTTAIDLAPSAETRAKLAAQRAARTEREEKLRRMMDDDDDDDAASASAPASSAKPSQDDAPDAEMPDWDATPPPEAAPEADAAAEEQPAPAPPGRRRGRRRVMRKRTTKDAEGYLVTREEAAWESFSEDEAVAPAPVSVAVSAPPAAKRARVDAAAGAGKKDKGEGEGDGDKKGAGGGGAGKKGAGGKGQGNIMSFFAKK